MKRPLRHLRWYIGGLLFLSTVINYIDRQTLSVLGPILKNEFHWTNSDFALLVIAFRVAYAFGQTASGRFLDRVGTRAGLSLTRRVLLDGGDARSLAGGLRSSCALPLPARARESANWPGATKAVAEWFPRRESGWAVALFDSGSSIGAAVAPFIVLGVYQATGSWRPAFIVTGIARLSVDSAVPLALPTRPKNIRDSPTRRAAGHPANRASASLAGEAAAAPPISAIERCSRCRRRGASSSARR